MPERFLESNINFRLNTMLAMVTNLVFYCEFLCFVAERLLEDDASVVECMMNWDTVSSNQIHFVERVDKYDLFRKPEVCTIARVDK